MLLAHAGIPGIVKPSLEVCQHTVLIKQYPHKALSCRRVVNPMECTMKPDKDGFETVNSSTYLTPSIAPLRFAYRMQSLSETSRARSMAGNGGEQ